MTSPSGKPQVSQFSKRCVALVLDVAAAYFGAIVVSFLIGLVFFPLPIVSRILSGTTIMVLYLLVRDFLFEGRGVGKNMVGLQVVDAVSKLPASLTQSALRNITWLAPFVVLIIAQGLVLLIPLEWMGRFVLNLAHGLGTLYCMVMYPLESYRAYYRADSRRIGDRLAGTEVIESRMDFSRPIPRENSQGVRR